MKQTNVNWERERLVLSLSVASTEGYKIAKDIAKIFLDNKVHYKFFKSKNSAVYNFADFYIKVYYSHYGDSKVEITVYKNNIDVKKILDMVMADISKAVIPCEQNSITLYSNSTFDVEKNVDLVKINKNEYTDYSFKSEEKMYNLTTKIRYSLNVASKEDNKIVCKDSVTMSMHIDNAMVTFTPNLFGKFFVEVAAFRGRMVERIEEI